jgi:hypothetical protein
MLLESECLSLEIINLMIQENIYVCRVKNFLDIEKCNSYAQNIIAWGDKDKYEVNKSVSKIGSTIFDYAFNKDVIDYFSKVEENNKNINSIFVNQPPSQLVFDNISSIWPYGCQVETFYGQSAYYGVIRIFDNGGTAPPHQDMTVWDIKGCPEVQSISKQFSVNVYMRSTDNGGNLIVYDRQILEEPEYQSTFFKYLNIGFQEAHQELVKMNTKFVQLKPCIGDLIIFNSQNFIKNILSFKP